MHTPPSSTYQETSTKWSKSQQNLEIKKHFSWLLSGIIVIKICIIGAFFWMLHHYLTPHTATPELCFHQQCISLESADTPEQQQRWLSQSSSLQDNQGMLFVFPTLDIHPIHMQGISFPLDIIWMDQDFNIVDIQQAEICKSYPCPLYTPKSKALYILQLRKGNADRLGLSIGSTMEYQEL